MATAKQKTVSFLLAFALILALGIGAITSTGAEPYAPGDVNGDTKVDVEDILLCRDAIFGKELSPEAFGAADVNGEGVISVGSILGIRDIVFGVRTPGPDETGEPMETETSVVKGTSTSEPTNTPIERAISYEMGEDLFLGSESCIVVSFEQLAGLAVSLLDSKYDEAFFEHNALVYVKYILPSSGWQRNIEAIINTGTLLRVDLLLIPPFFYLPYANSHSTLLEVKKSDLHDVELVVINKVINEWKLE